MAPDSPDPGTLKMLAAELKAGKTLVEEGQARIAQGKEKVRLCVSGIEKILKYYPGMSEKEKNAYIAIKEQCEQLLASSRDAEAPDLRLLEERILK
jgi:hypothetical protein